MSDKAFSTSTDAHVGMVPLRLAPPHVATRESGRPITEPPQKGYNVEIFDYMKARAESENVEHALPIGWYFTHLFMGVRSFST